MTFDSYKLLGMCFSAAVIFPQLAVGVDKNGVSPQAISLPSGPGSVSGLGEHFQPDLNTGGGTYSVPLRLPKAANGLAPDLALVYQSGGGNGLLGVGWRLTGIPLLQRRIDRGLPRYVDGPNGVDDDGDGFVDTPGEVDLIAGLDGEDLVPLEDGSYRAESEESFVRYRRAGDGWEAQLKNGTLLELGMTPAARIEKNGAVFRWLLERTTDTNSNAVELKYTTDADSPGQKYPRVVRWGQQQSFYAVVFSYDETRPDILSDFSSTFEVRTARRLSRIDVMLQGMPAPESAMKGDLNGDGTEDALIRSYRLSYKESGALSLLASVVEVGWDNQTSLPALNFEYTEWASPGAAQAIIRSTNLPPGIALATGSVELVDLNRDALPDLLATSGAFHVAYLNFGTSSSGEIAWSAEQPILRAPNLDLASPLVHLADMNGDGIADLVEKTAESRIQYFRSTGAVAWETAPSLLTAVGSRPLWPFDGAPGDSTRTLDCDGNHLTDILYVGQDALRLWLQLPGGRYAREIQRGPILAAGRNLTFSTPGVHLADLNGDQLQDLARIGTSNVVYWANAGRGIYAEAISIPLGAVFTQEEATGATLQDVNADGLADLVLERPARAPGSILYWLNGGARGFWLPGRLDGLPVRLAGDAVRWADMNGNGSIDLLVSNPTRDVGESLLVVDFVRGTRPNLLQAVSNGLGHQTRIAYGSSAVQMVLARDTGRPWSNTMPIAVPVLVELRELDGLGWSRRSTFVYRDPHYDPDRREFRGFAEGVSTDEGDSSAPTRVMRRVFDVGAKVRCFKGRLLKEELLDSAERLFRRTVHDWQHRTLAAGTDGRAICFANLKSEAVHLFEGGERPKLLRTELEYDDYGNVTVERKLGDVDAQGEEVVTRKDYIAETGRWILQHPWRERVTDGEELLQAERRFYYDGEPTGRITKGNLVRSEGLLAQENRFVTLSAQDFDGFGNVIRTRDAEGRVRVVEYDPFLHAYPVIEAIQLLEGKELAASAEYELGIGAIKSFTDFSGSRTEVEHDALGRVVMARSPGGALSAYEYRLSNPVSSIVQMTLETVAGGTFDVVQFSDGLGRALGKKIEAKAGRWRYVGAVAFNAHGLPAMEWLPYLADSADPESPDATRAHESLAYDVAGRLVQRVHTDGTATKIVLAPLTQDLWDENDVVGLGQATTQRQDGLGRLVEVVERNKDEAYSTQYLWSVLGDLIKIVDPQGNIRTQAFDSLRRMIRCDDPDRGTTTYQYDDAGLLRQTTDAKGQTIEYAYDRAGRLIAEYHRSNPADLRAPDVTYAYDVAEDVVGPNGRTTLRSTFTTGRLSHVLDRSGGEYFSYDSRGNIAWTVKAINTLGTSYWTGISYDLMNRVTDVSYPDGDSARYQYSTDSLLQRVDGGPNGQVIIARVDYSPTGKWTHIEHGNGIVTERAYDSLDRLVEMRTIAAGGGELLDCVYTYDAASNILAIGDRRPLEAGSPRSDSQLFEYDELHRLQRFQLGVTAVGDAGGKYLVEYRRDSIGNLLYQGPPEGAPENVQELPGAYHYAGGRYGRSARQFGAPPGPHAVTSTESGAAYEYDSNGNMVSIVGKIAAWDVLDRMIRIDGRDIEAEYAYDYSGRRVSKLVNTAGRAQRTAYINDQFEIRDNGQAMKHVKLGGIRLARIVGSITPTASRLQWLRLDVGWNAVTVCVQPAAGHESAREVFWLERNREISAIYRRQGRAFSAVSPDETIKVGEPLFVLAASALVVTVSGTYAAEAATVDVAAPLDLVGWPRLHSLESPEWLPSAEHAWVLNATAGQWQRLQSASPEILQLPVWRSPPPGTALFVANRQTARYTPPSGDSRDVLYYHADHLGSPRVVTDGGGNVVEETAYYPYGRRRASWKSGRDLPAEQDFTGQERDEESGLHQFGMRSYTSDSGVFVSYDPKARVVPSRWLGTPQLLNPYAYAGGNPISFVDTTGGEPEGADRWEQSVAYGNHLAQSAHPLAGAPMLLRHVFSDPNARPVGDSIRDKAAGSFRRSQEFYSRGQNIGGLASAIAGTSLLYLKAAYVDDLEAASFEFGNTMLPGGNPDLMVSKTGNLGFEMAQMAISPAKIVGTVGSLGRIWNFETRRLGTRTLSYWLSGNMANKSSGVRNFRRSIEGIFQADDFIDTGISMGNDLIEIEESAPDATDAVDLGIITWGKSP